MELQLDWKCDNYDDTPKEVQLFTEIAWKMCGLSRICRKRKSYVTNLREFRP